LAEILSIPIGTVMSRLFLMMQSAAEFLAFDTAVVVEE
jgi:DNA-directed RNA polymerase specialized sigma24 family protein